MPARFVLLLVMLSIVTSTLWCESTDCGSPVLIVVDGRITGSTFPASTTYWYGIYGQAGHSYSVEFEPPADNFVGAAKVQFAPIGVFGPNDALVGCRGTSSLTVTQNSGYAPVILKGGNGAGRRVSFTAQSAGLYLISASNTASVGNYTFRAIDTTMLNLRWSTAGRYSDQWGFLNRSDMPITGTFTVYDLTNHAVASVQFTVPPGGEVVRYSDASDLNLAGNISGYGIFSHNGPAGAIIADAYMISPTGSLIVYSKFESAPTN